MEVSMTEIFLTMQSILMIRDSVGHIHCWTRVDYILCYHDLADTRPSFPDSSPSLAPGPTPRPRPRWVSSNPAPTLPPPDLAPHHTKLTTGNNACDHRQQRGASARTNVKQHFTQRHRRPSIAARQVGNGPSPAPPRPP